MPSGIDGGVPRARTSRRVALNEPRIFARVCVRGAAIGRHNSAPYASGRCAPGPGIWFDFTVVSPRSAPTKEEPPMEESPGRPMASVFSGAVS